MKELPKFTEGPWKIGNRSDGSKWIGMGDGHSGRHYQADMPWDMFEEDCRLIAASPLLYMALWAQEIASEMQKENMLKVSANDERYTPFIGPWDGKQSTEDRFWAFQTKRRQLRAEALKQARGE